VNTTATFTRHYPISCTAAASHTHLNPWVQAAGGPQQHLQSGLQCRQNLIDWLVSKQTTLLLLLLLPLTPQANMLPVPPLLLQLLLQRWETLHTSSSISVLHRPHYVMRILTTQLAT
jgi:hypothetical protein